jgi:hypothetical protein
MHTTSPKPQPTTIPPSSPERVLIERVLQEAFMHEGKTHSPIVKRDGGNWTTWRHGMSVAEALSILLDPDRFLGMQPARMVRVVTVDVDNHVSGSSRYWHPQAQNAELTALAAAAEAAGVGVMIHRSSANGGIHVRLVLPVAVHRHVAALIGRLLVKRAGMVVDPGQCELFPDWTPYTEAGPADPKALRLPGQKGSALWTGSGWATDPMMQWQELESLLDAAEITEAWGQLLTDAEALKAPLQHEARARRRSAGAKRYNVVWTGSGESNRNLGLLALNAYAAGADTLEALTAEIIRLAHSATGFFQHASEATQRALPNWARDWARCCLRKAGQAPQARPGSTDSGHNARLQRESNAKVIDSAARAVKLHGAAALDWSDRQLSKFAGVCRKVAARTKKAFLAAAVRVLLKAEAGTHPRSKGGDREALDQCFSTDLSPNGSILGRFSPNEPAGRASPPLKPPPPPNRPDPGGMVLDRRERERAELLAWIGATG